MLKYQKNGSNYPSKNSLHTFSRIMVSQKPYYTWQMVEKEASHETLFFLFYSLNINMTLVSDSPHVASLLRINISKFGYALQAFFILRYSPHVASLLRINISKLGCALQANFIYAIALTSLRSSGSISLSSVEPYRLTSLRAIEKEHTVHFA